MASAHLHRTLGTPTNEKKWTYSAWIKRSQYTAGHGQFLIACFTDASNRGRVYIEDGANSQLEVADRVGGSFDLQKKTNAMLRDESAWYHIVVGHDRTIATPVTNMYINGVLQTSFAGDNTVSQNAATSWNKSGSTMLIGKYGGGAQYFSGSMAHVHFCDGYLYAASDFGQTNTSTGIWTPKTSPSVTYGNNGFFLKFDNSGNMGLDSSGESNNFTTSGTIIQPKDTPSNVFATLNPLTKDGGGAKTYSNVNTTVLESADSWTTAHSTLGVTTGKWYYEGKVTYSNNQEAYLGACSQQTIQDRVNSTHYLGQTTGSVGYYTGNGSYYKGAGAVSYGSAVSGGNIVGVALDLDNNFIYFSINGVWQNSGNPASGASGTNGISLPSGMTSGDNIFLSVSPNQSTINCNFGNGYFGTTAVSSAQNPDDGIGIFEYDVPAGYRALCTKSINAEEYS